MFVPRTPGGYARRMPRTSRPLQPSKEVRRLTLARLFIDAVTPLLESGSSYSDLSVERLITSVEVSRSTFYAYFTDKADLLTAMGEDVTLDLAEAGSSWFELGHPEGQEALRDALRPLFDTYRRHQMILRSITEAAAYDAAIRELHAGLVARAVSGLQGHIESLSSGLDAGRTAVWLVWMLERGLYQVVAPATEREANRQLDALAALLWRCLYS